MPDPVKLKTLKDLQFKLQTNQISEDDQKKLIVVDTDGTPVQLNDDRAPDVLARRIAALEASQ